MLYYQSMPKTSSRLAPKDERVTARLTSEAKDMLLAVCNKLGVGESAVVEMAIRAFAEEHGIKATPRLTSGGSLTADPKAPYTTPTTTDDSSSDH